MTTRRKVLAIVGISAVIGANLGMAGHALGFDQGVSGGVAGGICAVVATKMWRRAS